ncbi:MAG: cytoplasmic iron level regulating protein YaaA (DUF328/UPF0246 family) [Halioglobus sp.]|jgi:cytoplasmic iron level regulating protein YaaA (DUF328/UPF0246 family)
MITLLSPAKTLDFETPDTVKELTIPQFTTQTNQLVRILKKKSVEEIKAMMHISDNLAVLNKKRYKTFSKEYTDGNAKSAIMAFKGDVYTGLEAETLDSSSLEYVNEHVRILSGMYGLLMPFDRMQPYRLEMGTRLENKKGTNLYHFWGDMISKSLNKELKEMGADTIVNLASNEYYKAVGKKKLKAKVIDIDFREDKDGEYKFVSFFAKKARGTMTRYIAENKITAPSDLRGFDYDNYRFEERGSSENQLLFVR